MVVVTAAAGGERSGCLVGFSTQCSIDPVRFLACVSKENHTLRVAEGAEFLGVHVLGPGDRDLAALFGSTTGDEVDKFAACEWRPALGGVPVLPRVQAWFVGRVLDRLDCGDHVGFLLEPVEEAVGEWSGQLGFQSLRDLPPGHPA